MKKTILFLCCLLTSLIAFGQEPLRPTLFLSILGCGFRVVSFFYLLQDGIDCFCTVPPASVAKEGFTADGISVKCGSIDGISLRAGEGVEGSKGPPIFVGASYN